MFSAHSMGLSLMVIIQLKSGERVEIKVTWKTEKLNFPWALPNGSFTHYGICQLVFLLIFIFFFLQGHVYIMFAFNLF